MSYRQHHRRHHAVARRAPMGELPDWMNDLLDQAGAGTSTVEVDNAAGQEALRLAAAWHPTGFFTPDQIDTIVGRIDGVMMAAIKAADDYRTGSFNAGKANVLTLENKVGKRRIEGLVFTKTAAQARATGKTIIDAPGLKQWVLSSLNAISLLLLEIQRLEDIKPAIVSALEVVYDTMQAAARVVAAIVGVAWDVVKAAGAAVLKVPSTVGALITLAKWGVLGVAGWWIWEQAKKL